MSQTMGTAGTTGTTGAPVRTPDMEPTPSSTLPSTTSPATDHGKTTIADIVVAKIAGICAREIDGVHELLAQGPGSALAGAYQRVTGGDQRAHGVNVEVGEREAAVDLRMTVNYGVSIHQVAEAVRRNIINRVQAMTGLSVREVNIAVDDLYFPEEERLAQPPAEPRVQ